MRMKKKRFSIITPTLNSARKLEATIKSVLSQSKELFEYIIVDGCSSDETLKMIDAYAGEIKYVSERDRGVYDAMNKGIRMSAGDYLYFLGAGDRLRPNILEKIDRLIPHQELLIMAYGNVYLVDENRHGFGKFSRMRMLRRNICHQAIFYERTIFERVGEYNLRYVGLADYALNLKCFGDDRIKKLYVDEVIADYEGSGLSMGTDVNFTHDRADLIKENFGVWLYSLERLREFKNTITGFASQD